MKRGAEDGDSSARSDRNGNRGWKRPDQKRIRLGDRERPCNGNDNADTGYPKVKTLAGEKETDPHRLAQRQKQIDYGKNTIGYDRYCALVPRHQRRPGKHPMTPDKSMRIGKKVFDGIVRKWRQTLHTYDPPELTEAIRTVETDGSAAAMGASSSCANAGDVKTETETATATPNAAPMATSSEPEVTKKEVASNPTCRSIYENFDEDNFDEGNDSDDDLL